MNMTVYGKVAYEGFAKAIASKLGLRVQVDDGATACINSGGLITIPGMSKFQTHDEFEVTCGTIVHEMAHQFYGSHKLIDPNRDRLEHECLNAALDVADETWIDAYFQSISNARPGQLLAFGNEQAVQRRWRDLRDWGNANTHAWKVLAVGILAARGVRRMTRLKRHTIQEADRLGVDAKACFVLLRKARLAKGKPSSPDPRRFIRIKAIARKLSDLLRPFAPQQDAPTKAMPGGLEDGAMDTGYDQVPAGATEATEAMGAANADAPVGSGFDGHSYSLLFPAAERIATRIAIDGDGLDTEYGLSNGSRLGEAHRLLTDGMCLSRWQTNDNADGVVVSVVLDCSDSMRCRLTECAGVARAFSQAMRNAGPVQSLVFGSKVHESNDFDTVKLMGSTATHRAVRRSTQWLETNKGRKWIVIVTDGRPDCEDLANAAVADAVARGIKVMVVGLGVTLRMPNATCVTASDAAHLAIELDNAAHQIECGA